jgi:hypothetical protein
MDTFNIYDIGQIQQPEWMSDWLLFNAKSGIFHLYHGENMWMFNEMMMSAAAL